jgi:RNA polymerase sigma-70 factor (ECF subfamily)
LKDLALVSRARMGEPEALQALLERYQDVAYSAALRLLGAPADAEDVMQDALVRAYTHLDGLGDGASFAAWVRKIAINLSLNVLRRRGAIRFEPLEGNPKSVDEARDPQRDFIDERSPSPEDMAVNASLRDQIEDCLQRLPAEQRVAVVLRDMYGYDLAEVAGFQRCGQSAAKMRIARGRAHLKRLLVEANAFPPGVTALSEANHAPLG